MKNKSLVSQSLLVVEQLNVQARNERLKNLFFWLEAPFQQKFYREYPAQMVAYQTIFEHVNRSIDECISAKKRGDVASLQTYIHLALDGLLALLKEKAKVHTAPTAVYIQLLYVLTEKELRIESNQVAKFLYYKRSCVTVRVLMALMIQASRMHEYPTAL